MASFFNAAYRIMFKQKPREGRMTEEQAQNLAGRANPDSAIMSSTLGGGSQLVTGERQLIMHDEESLTLFRVMLGIQSSPYLGFALSGPYGTRPAANIGLYARVVHSEQTSKDRFKVWSVIINSSYFLQIVIAAALTALGAAGASSGAVTAFGAFNTIIAGALTFLKGTGLPGRLKYYGNEWKRLREYIEQRERDFMRPGNRLNVYDVVDTIEKMYNKLKEDIELNTPDAYTSLQNQRGHHENNEDGKQSGGFDLSKLQAIANKIPGMQGKLDSLTGGITQRADALKSDMHENSEKISGGVQQAHQQVVEGLQDHKAHLDREVSERQAQTLEALEGGKNTARGLKDQADSHRVTISDEARDYYTQAHGALDEEKQALQAAKDQVDSQRAAITDVIHDYDIQAHGAIDLATEAVQDEIEGQEAAVTETAQQVRAQAVRTISDTHHMVQEQIEATSSHAHSSIAHILKELSEIHKTAVGSGRAAAASRIRSLAERLSHQDGHEEMHEGTEGTGKSS
ncbi:hypothetical protein F5Y16DRAFT_387282 [Xylariaceae sp. FL0255]|nr:hypothetical protein F5Y16DRAFT_387282 [Xylariaceae sp. FL0255]